MKKTILTTLVLALGLVLAACGSDSEKTSSTEKEKAPTAAEQKDVSNAPSKDDKGNIVFTEVGQKSDIEGGTLELLKIKDINETVDIAPLKVTMKDIKLFKMTNLDEEFKNDLSYESDAAQSIGDEFTYVQIQYDVENTEEKNIEWYALTDLVTDKGQQIDAISNDFIYTEADGDSVFLGKVKKEFVDAFIVKDEDISKLKLIFGSSMDADSYEDITPEQQVEYTF